MSDIFIVEGISKSNCDKIANGLFKTYFTENREDTH